MRFAERTLVVALAWAGAGCIPVGAFECTDDGECGARGHCEPSGYCSAPDDSCDSGRRYSRYAPDGTRLSCVEDAPGATTNETSSGAPVTTVTTNPGLTSTSLATTSSGSDSGSATGTATATGSSESSSSGSPPLSACVAPGRADASPVLLYDFCEGAGATISSVTEEPYPLEFMSASGTPTPVQWVDDGLTVPYSRDYADSGAFFSTMPLFELLSPCIDSGEFTLEIWLTPEDSGRGPNWLFTIDSQANGDFSLWQNLAWGDKGYRANLKTDADAGWTDLSWSGTPLTKPSHLVFVRTADEQDSMFLDGELVASEPHPGDLSTWNGNANLVLAGNPATLVEPAAAGRYWYGTLHLVALYCSALTPEDVVQNTDAGHRPASE